MFPTLNELFHALFGIGFIPLPTFGFFVALSFISAAWVFTIELKRKENEGFLHPYPEKIWVGVKATPYELFSSGLFGFIVGFKLVYAVLHWSEFVADPRGVLLSTEGNWLMGIVLAIVFAGQTYRQKHKTLLAEPKEELVEIHPFELVSNMTMVAAVVWL